MRILFDHAGRFLLAHGGFQIQIEESKKALERLGVEVEFLRWWDTSQKGDLIHYFGPVPLDLLQQARNKGIRTVLTNLLSVACNRSDFRLRCQGMMIRSLLRFPLGDGIKRQLQWRAFSECDQFVVGLHAEERLLQLVLKTPQERISVVPLGMSNTFLSAGTGSRSEPFLICVGTITECKGSVPLARLARLAKVPLLFVGKPYSESDTYWQEFRSLVDGQWVRYLPHTSSVEEMVGLLHRARGAVIMSDYENWCLAAHEAACCGLPVLLPPLKWSHERFGEQARYFTGNLSADVGVLKNFYHDCPGLPAPRIALHSWDDVAGKLSAVYQSVLSRPWK